MCCFLTFSFAVFFLLPGHLEGRQGKSRLSNTAGDWCSTTAGPQRPAVRRQAVPAVGPTMSTPVRKSNSSG